MKFKAGDEFFMQNETGRSYGEIVSAHESSGFYLVRWDSLPFELFSAKSSNVDKHWEKVEEIFSELVLAPGKGNCPLVDSQCKHEFVLYHGLKESFEYCKKCDQRKAKDESR